MDIRGTQDLSFGDDGALVMDFEEDRVRPKRSGIVTFSWTFKALVNLNMCMLY